MPFDRFIAVNKSFKTIKKRYDTRKKQPFEFFD